MADLSRGRLLVTFSLVVITALTILLSLITAGSSGAASTYGRPAIVALGCLLLWQGRLWARWLVLLMGLGVLLAGPIAQGNGVPLLTLIGILFWTASLLYAISLYILFFVPEAKAFLATADARTRGSVSAG